MDGLFELACLFYEVSSRFYTMDTEKYMAAKGEINRLACEAGYTMNDVGQIATCSE